MMEIPQDFGPSLDPRLQASPNNEPLSPILNPLNLLNLDFFAYLDNAIHHLRADKLMEIPRELLH
jgi:hypothetical protein